MTNPKRGEIGLVQLDSTQGEEIQKTRPALIISSNLFRSVALRMIVLVRRWQAKFINRPFMVSIPRTEENRLEEDSAGNVLQIRSISTERFVNRLGKVSTTILQELLIVLIICVDYEDDRESGAIAFIYACLKKLFCLQIYGII